MVGNHYRGLAEGKLAIDIPFRISHFVHAIHVRSGLILTEDETARGTDRAAAVGPVVPHAGHDHPQHAPPKASTTLFIITSTDGLWPLTTGPSVITAFTALPNRHTCRCFPPGAIRT